MLVFLVSGSSGVSFVQNNVVFNSDQAIDFLFTKMPTLQVAFRFFTIMIMSESIAMLRPNPER